MAPPDSAVVGGKKKVYLYIWLLCRLFDILDMPFSLQYVNLLSPLYCKKEKKEKKKEEEDEAANDSAETNYSPNFPFEIPARGRAPTFLILVTELA